VQIIIRERIIWTMKSRISKILGIGLSSGLVLGLIGALFAAPASADLMEWGIVNTPSWEDLVILPASDILDYDIGGDGDTIYAVLDMISACTEVGWDIPADGWGEFALVKSTDGGITWTDITDNVTGAANLPASFVWIILTAVAVAPDDEAWLAVAGRGSDGNIWVVASKDGGDNFSFTGLMNDTTDGNWEITAMCDMDVSVEVDGVHNIAVSGIASPPNAGAVYRLKAGTWLTGAWEDTSDANYPGWDNGIPTETEGVVAVAFSPNFDLDDTIVCFGIDDSLGGMNGEPYLQSGIWESSGGSWNDEAGFPSAVKIASNGDTLQTGIYNRSIGLALPADYDGSDPGTRAVFVYANAYNVTDDLVGGYLFRVDNDSVSLSCGPPGNPLLASIDVYGDADTGKMMIGEYIQWDNQAPDEGERIEADCCAGVRVWHTEELDFCCPQWDGACKNPSGPYMALVMYTPDGEKEYASTSGRMDIL
jgi:hypothetical protein